MSADTDPGFVLNQDASPDAARMGGKAAALARLGRAGIPVPHWFVVTPEAFAASAGELERCEPTSPAAGLATLSPAPDVTAAVEQALAWLDPGGAGVAVRSSGVDEDGAQHSFAGQLESFLNVASADVPRRIADVWRSAFSHRVLAYRREQEVAGASGARAPAVLVQRMVDAHVAGVAFSADPVTGRRGVTVISAVRGLADRLVAGEAEGDTFHVDRTGEIIARQCAEPAVMSDSQARAVAALAWCAAEHFGRPQDIEWAMEGSSLYLLQSRPITTLGGLADPDGVIQIWDNANIAESYSGITTPLTFSFARRAYEEVYRQFCLMMGVAAGTVEEHRNTFRNMLGLVRGRVYYNLLNWYRVLAMLPGFAANRRFMEQMMGVREGLPDTVVAELGHADWRQRFADRLRLVRTILSLVANHFLLDRRIARFYEGLDEALRPPDPPLAMLRLDELAAAYRQLERRLLTRWDAPLVNDFFAMVHFGLLGELTGRWCADAEGRMQNDLLCGEGDVVSTEPARRIARMAHLAAEEPTLVDVLCDAEAVDAVRALREHASLAQEFDAYLDRFGDRCLEELKLESSTLLDDPLPLLRAIGQTARRRDVTGAPQANVAEQMRREAETRVAGAIGRNPWRRMVFRWVLGHARRRVRDRENLRFERTRLFGRVRRIFSEIGRRLCASDLLDDPRDVFYLETEEALGFVEGTLTCDDLRALVRARRERFDHYRDLPAPDDRFSTRGAVHLGNAFADDTRPGPVESGLEVLHGTGCCPGIVRGKARVIRDPRGAEIEHGEILVAERTDPGWIMLFPAAAGVLVERGSLLSHSAIVAREMGIPAVVGVAGLTQILCNGEWVEMNGTTGEIHRIRPPEAPEPDDTLPGERA